MTITEKRTLKEIIDYGTAPLVQWEPVVGDIPSEGKLREDFLTHGAIDNVLTTQGAKHITGIIADEGRLEIALGESDHSRVVNLLTLSGAFEDAARYNLGMATRMNPDGAKEVHVLTDIDAIPPHSQDAIVMNMILGCLATSDDHDNLHKMLCFVSTLLKPDGKLITVRPNPAGGKFSTYACTTEPKDLKAGKDYGFIVKGLEEYGTMCNLYTPDSFMQELMDKNGFNFGPTAEIQDFQRNKSDAAPFLLNVSPLKPI